MRLRLERSRLAVMVIGLSALVAALAATQLGRWPVTPAAPQSPTQESKSALEVAPHSELLRTERVSVAQDVTPPEGGAAQATTAIAEAAIAEAQGRLLVKSDVLGAWYADEGSVTWERHRPGEVGVETTRTRIESGVWRLNAVPGSVFLPIACQVSSHGRSLEVAVANISVLAEHMNGFVVEAHTQEGCRLHVVDAESGEHLKQVECVLDFAGSGLSRVLATPPSPIRIHSGFKGDSPLMLPAFKGMYIGWARAEGYGWGRFAISAESKQLEISLRRGGTLQVALSVGSGKLASGCTALLYRTTEAGELSPGVMGCGNVKTGSKVLFDGLLPARYLIVLVENERVGLIGPRLGQMSVLVAAGEVTEVELTLGGSVESATLGAIKVDCLDLDTIYSTTGVATTVVLELEGGADDGVMPGNIVKSFHAAAIDAAPEVEFDGLGCGNYFVSVPTAGVIQKVTLAPGERRIVRLKPVDEAKCTVRAVGGAGRPLAGAEVSVRPVGGRGGIQWVNKGRTNSEGELQFSWFAGESELSAALGPESVAMKRIRLIAGERYFSELNLSRRGHLSRPILLDEANPGAVLPSTFWHSLQIEPIDRDRVISITQLRPIAPPVHGGLSVLDYRGIMLGVDGPGECVIRANSAGEMHPPITISVVFNQELNGVPIYLR